MTTLIGIIFGFALVIAGIGAANLTNFIDLSSVWIVVGGTAAATAASVKWQQLCQIPLHMRILFGRNRNRPMRYVQILEELAIEARKGGVPSLEGKTEVYRDPFLTKGISLIVDSFEADKVREILEVELDSLEQRHDAGIVIYQKAATFAPAFGMIGTLIGLINMLKSLSLDMGGSDTLGTGMSVALVTTFYGSMLANLVFLPIANKLTGLHEDELLCKQIVVEGVLAIEAGESPHFVREKLLGFLREKERRKKKKPAAPRGFRRVNPAEGEQGV